MRIIVAYIKKRSSVTEDALGQFVVVKHFCICWIIRFESELYYYYYFNALRVCIRRTPAIAIL